MSRLPHVPPDPNKRDQTGMTLPAPARHLRGIAACVQPIATLPYEALRRAWSLLEETSGARAQLRLQRGHGLAAIKSEQGGGIEPEPRKYAGLERPSARLPPLPDMCCPVGQTSAPRAGAGRPPHIPVRQSPIVTTFRVQVVQAVLQQEIVPPPPGRGAPRQGARESLLPGGAGADAGGAGGGPGQATQPGTPAPQSTIPDLPLPPTVQVVLAARIDRLTPEAKRLLQTAAVIGMDVPMPLLDHRRTVGSGPPLGSRTSRRPSFSTRHASSPNRSIPSSMP